MDNGSEREMVRRMLGGDEVAFDEFFADYFPRLFRFGGPAPAGPGRRRDIVQNSLIAAVRNLGSWRGEAALFTWLCTICRREISAWEERTSRPVIVSIADDDPVSSDERDANQSSVTFLHEAFARTAAVPELRQLPARSARFERGVDPLEGVRGLLERRARFRRGAAIARHASGHAMANPTPYQYSARVVTCKPRSTRIAASSSRPSARRTSPTSVKASAMPLRKPETLELGHDRFEQADRVLVVLLLDERVAEHASSRTRG